MSLLTAAEDVLLAEEAARRPWLAERLPPYYWFALHKHEYHLKLEAIKALRGESPPRLDGSGVYFLFNDDDLQYVGMSGAVGQRINSHYYAQRIPFNQTATIFVCPLFVDLVEGYHIQKLRPPYNIRGK